MEVCWSHHVNVVFVSCVHPYVCILLQFLTVRFVWFVVCLCWLRMPAETIWWIEAYSSEGLVMVLYVATRVSFCLTRDVVFFICSALCFVCGVFSVFVVCEFGVKGDT